MSEGILGKLFDFNGDGEVDSIEQAAELTFLEELTKEESDDDSDEAGLSITIDISLGSGGDEDDDWRDQYYGNEYYVEPDDFDTEEEYLAAVEEKRAWIDGISDKIMSLADDYDIEPEDFDTYDEFIAALKDEMG